MNTKNTMKVIYAIKRDKANHCYYLMINDEVCNTIKRTDYGWYACTMYHRTLRDAIIYCLYGE